jgi:hypothetical protein
VIKELIHISNEGGDRLGLLLLLQMLVLLLLQ